MIVDWDITKPKRTLGLMSTPFPLIIDFSERAIGVRKVSGSLDTSSILWLMRLLLKKLNRPLTAEELVDSVMLPPLNGV